MVRMMATSPETDWRRARPVTLPNERSPLAVFEVTSPSTSGNDASPDALRTLTSPHVPVHVMSADAEVTSTDERLGAVTSIAKAGELPNHLDRLARSGI